jgi:membrane-bound lytic murein transglycosylase D
MRLKLLALLLACTLAPLAVADDAPFPRPAALEPDVQFWIKVYTEVTTNAGFIHDQRNLAVIYETLHFDPDTSIREREHKVEAERDRFHDILLRLSRGAAPASDEERRVLALWGEAAPARLAVAAEDVRFQLGQADRFRAGLIRAGAWETHIADVLARLGLPPELAVLPHVESSFDPAAYSKVGAAGLWQFLRSTGRRFLRIDSAVDERLDPFRETEAAAQLLSYNYRLLGSWPLAITAYNHGAEGMRRARDELGTDDIVRVVHDYHSPTFGFASRNFYVSFLAALSVAQDSERYFGKLELKARIDSHDLKMPAPANVSALLPTLGVDRDTLQRLNPALRPAVWSGRRSIPAGYMLRLPDSAGSWTSQLLAQRLSTARSVRVASVSPPPNGGVEAPKFEPLALATLPTLSTQPTTASPASAPPAATSALASAMVRSGSIPGAAFVASAPFAPAPLGTTIGAFGFMSSANAAAGTGLAPQPSQYYLVQPGDSANSIADRTGVPLGQLMALNSLPGQDYLYAGEPLRLAASTPELALGAPASSSLVAQQAVQESREEAAAVALANRPSTDSQPVSALQAQAEGPQLLPGATGPESADPVDYSVAADGSVQVVAAETLGHYADWLGTSAARLRELNHLHGRRALVMGHRVVLEFKSVTPVEFEQRRREYHQRLQAAYFAAHRIVGTETYQARRGDSLWNITQHDLKVPIWLLQQYNPDLDFSDLRAGTAVVLPKIEDVTGT